MSGSTSTTLSCTIDATGISAPEYADVLSGLTANVLSVYGSDYYLDPDSQDGQLIAIFAAAIHDVNSMAVAAYNNMSPATAQGTGLSSIVKQNGIARLIPTFSTVDIQIGGVVGTTITNGIVTDSVGKYKWSLPPVVTIPISGLITVTATCQTAGAITAAPNTLANKFTPTLGWQTSTNLTSATPGAPVETDAALRLRQSQSTALPSRAIKDGITGAVEAIPGVARMQNYENDTDLTDINGQPPHSISLVVDGGDANTIAQTLFLKKSPGVNTYGTTTETITDSFGRPVIINFFRPSPVVITGQIIIKALSGYTSVIGDEIIAAVVQYITTLSIGDDVLMTRLYIPASLVGNYLPANTSNDGNTYELLSIILARTPNTPAASDVTIAFNEAATSDPTQWTLIVQ